MRSTDVTWTLEKAAFTAPCYQSIAAFPFSRLCFCQQNQSTCHQLILNHVNHFHHLFEQNVSTTAEEYRDIHGGGIVTARERFAEGQHVFKVSDASVLSYNTMAMVITMILGIVHHEEHFKTRRLGYWTCCRFILNWAHQKGFVSVTGFKRDTNPLSKTVCLKEPKTMDNSQNKSYV